MEELLTQAAKAAEAAEVFAVTAEEAPIHFEANRLKNIQSKQSSSIALRILKGGKIGYASTTGLDNPQKLIQMALETAQFGMTSRFTFPSLTSYPKVEVFDATVGSVPTEAMVRLGERLIARLTEHTPGLLCDGGVSKGVASVRIINSKSGQASYQQSVFSLSVWANLIRGTDILFVGDSQSSCHPIMESDTVARSVIQQLEWAKNQASVTTGTLPVVFTPQGVGSALITPLTSAFNGKTVLEGASPLGDKLGQLVFDKKLQLWDDPTIAYQPSSRPCDEEGVPSQRTPLIEKGVVANFLYDLQTAALAGKKSTGNGSRSRGGLPTPSASAFTIASGNTTFDDMVKDMKEGLVIEEVMGAEQGNILGGDFSGNILLGYKVEGGKIVGRVKNTMMFGNVYRLLKDIAAIGNDMRWVGGSLYIPSIYFPGVSVATK